MKTNNDMLHGGKLKPEFYDSWALYYTKFIRTMRKKEFQSGVLVCKMNQWQHNDGKSCIYSAEEERDF